MLMRPSLIGKQFGNLTVVKLDHTTIEGHNMWECRCCCGNTVVVRGAWLRKGMTVSCGCPLIKTEKKPVTISVGQKVRFDPFKGIKGFDIGAFLGNVVTGTVVMVNEPHQWFSVEYGDPKMLTSFKFSDIGKDVLICGH
jgi:hypothetical protein